MTLSVSVIIPTYNYGRFVGEAIESVLAQTLRAREVIVVDDGSTDDTAEVLRRYKGHIQIVRQQNGGVSAACNNGARLATGKLLAFLDADDVWLPRKLECQVGRFIEEPELGLVHCGVEEIDANGNVLRTRLEGLEGWVAREMLLYRRAVILGGGSGAVISKDAFHAVGGFDERIAVSQDWDIHYRVAVRWKVGFVPEVLLRYRLHGSNQHRNMRRMEHDMLLGYDKAFGIASPELLRLRRRSYGNLHMVLAGSFFVTRDFRKFAQHALKSVLLTPDNFLQLAGYPVRLWRRRKGSATV